MRRMSVIVALALGVASTAEAATIQVGPGDDWTKIEMAQPGDVVEIAPGTYQFRVYLTALGTEDAPIEIRAADPEDRPVWDLDGMLVEEWPGSYDGGDNGRGCWQVAGSSYRISGIVFQNCHTASGNAAGLRAIAAQDLLIRDVLFRDNDSGFSGDGEGVTIEFSEFDGNGQPSDPPQHSMYVYGGSFALRYSYVHDSVGGQNFHIRARESVLEYNWIARAGNYEGDMMPGNDPDHVMTFRGNVVIGSPTAANGSTVFALFNDGKATDITMELHVLWNTFVFPEAQPPVLVSIHNDVLESATVEIANNVAVGVSQAVAITDDGLGNATATGTNNWFETGSDVGPLLGTIFGSHPGFVDGEAQHYAPTDGSPLVDAADQTVVGPPDREYFDNEAAPMMFRYRPTALDIGALDHTTRGPGYGPYDDPNEPPPAGSESSDDGDVSASSADVTGATVDDGTSIDDGGTTGSSSSSSSDSGSESGNDGAASGDDGGCSCRTERSRSAAPWLAVCVWLVARRRRHGARREPSRALGW